MYRCITSLLAAALVASRGAIAGNTDIRSRLGQTKRRRPWIVVLEGLSWRLCGHQYAASTPDRLRVPHPSGGGLSSSWSSTGSNGPRQIEPASAW